MEGNKFVRVTVGEDELLSLMFAKLNRKGEQIHALTTESYLQTSNMQSIVIGHLKGKVNEAIAKK
jgi:hypothetical protein